MTSKPETIILQIKELKNKNHSDTFLEFNDWLLDDEDSSVRNASNYLMILRLFSVEISGKDLSEIKREDIIQFLDKRKKSSEVDPDKKWVRTWNDYLNRLIGFYRWYHNHETSRDREDWNTPEPFNHVKKKKIKRDSSYTPNDVWEIDELLLAVKYCDDVRDKAVFTIGWDMVSRNHEIVKVKIKDIIIKEKYAEVSTSWDTKTGVRTCPIIVGFPYLRELLNIHPFASEPNSYLLLSRTTSKPITEQPNIIVIMPDDIGWYNIGAYNDGIMAGITPNIDKIAENGMRFTDYYADPSCTAGRASFITGELPIRTGLTTVGQAGADIGMPAEAPTIASALKSMGSSTGQFGKNHLGDLNKFLPTVHGFDEFYGYLYHLDALEDPFHPTYPSELNLIIGPRNMIHSWASDVDDDTIEPRWGKVGKQVIEDMGPVPPKRMENLDDEILEHSINFMQKAVDEDKPFFTCINPSRMHVTTYLSEEYENKITPENGWSIYEAGMVEVDDLVGEVNNFLETNGIKENTIVIFTTDNGAEVFTWPDGGMTPFRGAKGQILEGGMRVPMLVQWPSHIPAGVVENGLMSGLDWMPTLVAAAGNPNITEELKEGKTIGDTAYKVHLDGYNQLDMLTGSGPSNRDVIYYFAQHEFGAVRIGDYKFRFIDQPNGWFGETVQLGWPTITNLRLDPFERAGLPDGDEGSIYYKDFFVFEFWRFVQAQQQIGELVPTFIEYPPMQELASFNLDSVKKKIEKMRALGD